MGTYDATTSVTDGITDNLAQYHNELKTAIEHAMSASAYAAYCTPASMTGNITLTDADLPVLSYSPTAARDLTLPAVATTNHSFYVINRSATYAITIKKADTSTLITLGAGQNAMLASDGANDWYAIASPSTSTISAVDATDLTDGGVTTLHTHAITATQTSFTPIIQGSTSLGTTEGTYTTQLGIYSQLGSIVFIKIVVIWTGCTGTGSLQIAGLPFTSANDNVSAALSLNWNSITLAAVGNKLMARVIANTKTILLYEIGSGAATTLPMDTAGTLIIAGFYFV